MRAWLAIVGYGALIVASEWFYSPNASALGAIFAVAALAILGSCVRWPGRLEDLASRSAPAASGLAILPNLLLFVDQADRQARFFRISNRPPRLALAAMGLLIVSYATGRRLAPGWRYPVLALIAAMMGAWAIVCWPRPKFDVLELQDDACRQLLRGIDPYSADHPKIRWNPRYDSQAVRKGAGLRSFPYPPMSLLAVVPGYLVGDIRWALLAATLGASGLMVAAGRRMGLPPGHVAELAAVALLIHPRALLVLTMGWTEPLLALAVAAGLWAAAAGRGWALGLATGAAVAVKQYGLLWAIPAWRTGRLRPRELATGLLFAAAVTVPFVVWDPPAFWLGNVLYHATSPSRPDSLSILAYSADRAGVDPPVALGLLVPVAVAVVVGRWGGPELSRATMGASALFLAFFLFGKAAHLNYYWFAGSLLLMAVVADLGEARGRGRAASSGAGAPSIMDGPGEGQPGDASRRMGTR